MLTARPATALIGINTVALIVFWVLPVEQYVRVK